MDAALQVLALEQFHHNERLPMLLVNFVNSADAGMIQRGRSLRLPFKAGQCLSIFGYFVGQKLQRDKAVQFHVLGLIDDTHPAAAQLLDDAVVRDSLADHALADHLADIIGLKSLG